MTWQYAKPVIHVQNDIYEKFSNCFLICPIWKYLPRLIWPHHNHKSMKFAMRYILRSPSNFVRNDIKFWKIKMHPTWKSRGICRWASPKMTLSWGHDWHQVFELYYINFSDVSELTRLDLYHIRRLWEKTETRQDLGHIFRIFYSTWIRPLSCQRKQRRSKPYSMLLDWNVYKYTMSKLLSETVDSNGWQREQNFAERDLMKCHDSYIF